MIGACSTLSLLTTELYSSSSANVSQRCLRVERKSREGAQQAGPQDPVWEMALQAHWLSVVSASITIQFVLGEQFIHSCVCVCLERPHFLLL